MLRRWCSQSWRSQCSQNKSLASNTSAKQKNELADVDILKKLNIVQYNGRGDISVDYYKKSCVSQNPRFALADRITRWQCNVLQTKPKDHLKTAVYVRFLYVSAKQ